MRRLAALLALFSTAATAQTDAASLVEAMHTRYADSWYRTVSFTQKTGLLRPDGTTTTETWREWAALPGRLRIEMEDPLAGPDLVFARDSTFLLRDGALARATAGRNALLTWGFDVYAQPPAVTLAALEEDGLALGTFRADEWDGRAMFVVGTPATGEVWIEQGPPPLRPPRRRRTGRPLPELRAPRRRLDRGARRGLGRRPPRTVGGLLGHRGGPSA